MNETLREICEKQYFRLNLRIRTEATRKQYRIALDCYGRHLGHEPTLDDLSDDALTIWMSTLLDESSELAVNTIRERVGRLTALWNWLARRGVVKTFPTLIKPAAPDTMPEALSEEQLRRLFTSARKERGTIGGVPADIWWESFLGFVWATSERKSAALAVRVEWLDLDRMFVRIPPKARKGGRKWGAYPLWPELVPLLKTCIAATPARDLVWPWDKCEGSYYTSFNRILRDAQIPVSRKTKTHALRVSHATWLKALGGDPTRRLGHSSSATTDRHYIDPSKIPDNQPTLFIPWQSPPAA